MAVSPHDRNKRHQQKLGPSHQHSTPPQHRHRLHIHLPRLPHLFDQQGNRAEGSLRVGAELGQAQYRLVVLLEDEDGFAELGHERC